MRLSLFDKSGAYSSPKFNIHTYPERFVKALTGYVLMSNEELGLNTSIQARWNWPVHSLPSGKDLS